MKGKDAKTMPKGMPPKGMAGKHMMGGMPMADADMAKMMKGKNGGKKGK